MHGLRGRLAAGDAGSARSDRDRRHGRGVERRTARGPRRRGVGVLQPGVGRPAARDRRAGAPPAGQRPAGDRDVGGRDRRPRARGRPRRHRRRRDGRWRRRGHLRCERAVAGRACACPSARSGRRSFAVEGVPRGLGRSSAPPPGCGRSCCGHRSANVTWGAWSVLGPRRGPERAGRRRRVGRDQRGARRGRPARQRSARSARCRAVRSSRPR